VVGTADSRGLLPVHAPGNHIDPADDPQRRTVLDRVISSYTRTVRTLHHARAEAEMLHHHPPNPCCYVNPTRSQISAVTARPFSWGTVVETAGEEASTTTVRDALLDLADSPASLTPTAGLDL
jgi:hypothetical protein